MGHMTLFIYAVLVYADDLQPSLMVTNVRLCISLASDPARIARLTATGTVTGGAAANCYS